MATKVSQTMSSQTVEVIADFGRQLTQFIDNYVKNLQSNVKTGPRVPTPGRQNVVMITPQQPGPSTAAPTHSSVFTSLPPPPKMASHPVSPVPILPVGTFDGEHPPIPHDSANVLHKSMFGVPQTGADSSAPKTSTTRARGQPPPPELSIEDARRFASEGIRTQCLRLIRGQHGNPDKICSGVASATYLPVDALDVRCSKHISTRSANPLTMSATSSKPSSKTSSSSKAPTPTVLPSAETTFTYKTGYPTEHVEGLPILPVSEVPTLASSEISEPSLDTAGTPSLLSASEESVAVVHEPTPPPTSTQRKITFAKKGVPPPHVDESPPPFIFNGKVMEGLQRVESLPDCVIVQPSEKTEGMACVLYVEKDLEKSIDTFGLIGFVMGSNSQHAMKFVSSIVEGYSGESDSLVEELHSKLVPVEDSHYEVLKFINEVYEVCKLYDSESNSFDEFAI